VEKAEELLAQFGMRAAPGYRGAGDLRAEVTAAREAMAALRARLRRGLEAKLRRRAEAEARLLAAHHEEREALLKRQYEVIRQEVEDLRQAADRIGLAAIAYETERGEIEQAESVIKSLRVERERLEVERQSNARRVTVEVEATPPHTRNRKSQVLAAGASGLAFFLAGALGIAYRDCRARRIYSRAEVVHGLGLRVIGSLPVRGRQRPVGRARRNAKHAYSAHLWREAINGVRTVLLYEASQQPLRVVLVTSAGPLEGKTTLASQLAVSIAAAGRQTLLIDADLRRPVLHHAFQVTQGPGLSEALGGERTVAAVVRPTTSPGLWLLPAGAFSERIPELLAQDRLRVLLEPLRSRYDFIVIDSSPVLPVNDALLIGQHVDAVLLSIRADRSRVPMVQEAYERLRALNIPVLGTVLNGLQPSPPYLDWRSTPPATG
jgi:capsular exopolysaccharide synthesis family protein